MGKEITLEQLAASSKKNLKPHKPANAPTQQVVDVEEQVPANQPQHRQEPRKKVAPAESPRNGAIKMSPADVAGALKKNNKIPEKEELAEDAPLVKDAFAAMDKRLAESKDWIENTMMPIVRKNAEEMALEKELTGTITMEGLKDDDAPKGPDDGDEEVKTTKETRDISDFNFEDDLDLNFDEDDNDSTDEDDDDLSDFEDDYLKDLNSIPDEDDEPAEEIATRYKFENNQVEEAEEVKAPMENKNTETNTKPVVEEEAIDKEIQQEADVEETPVEEEVKPAEIKEEKKENKIPESAVRHTEPAKVDESGDLDELMSDLDDADDGLNVVDDEDEDPEEVRERFKKSLSSVKVFNDPIDFHKFKIRKTAVDSSFVLSAIQTTQSKKKADWGLYHTKRSMTFTECSGPELDNLRKTIQNSNNVNGVIESLKFVYNHTEDANKPRFETWCKMIRTEDIESLYYGIYRACYSSANLIARICQHDDQHPKNCGKTNLIDTNIDDMVVYGGDNDNHDKIKAEFKDIVAKDTTTESNVFESTLMQISDDIVISYRPASLYTTFIQFSTLKPEITQKYSEILNTMAYIDGFFSIDRVNGELIPIEIKEYPKNINKTVLSKLKVYTSILKSLNNDQYNVLTGKLANIIEAPKITYVYPKATCPECGSEIAQENIDSMLNLLFTRAQLAQIRSL